MKGHNSIELKEDVVIHHIRTKNKLRKIVAYRTTDCELRKYHERIAAFLGKRFIPSIFSKGYTKGRSIYHNALSHMYNDYYIMMDMIDQNGRRLYQISFPTNSVDLIYKGVIRISPDERVSITIWLMEEYVDGLIFDGADLRRF